MRSKLAYSVALALVTAACGRGPTTAGRPPSFTADIAPILFDHCLPCHRDGQGAPFTLATFDDAHRRATKIARATATHHMPPWLPEPSDPPFVDERRLTPADIETIRRWVEAGAPEGQPSDLPPRPAFPSSWQLGQPDLVLTPPRPYPLAAGRDDVFRNLVIPVPLPAGTFIRAVEFQTGGAPVHHAVVHLDRTPSSRRRDGADGRPGFDGMGAPDTQEPEGQFIGWAPGRGPIVAPDGMPWRLEKGTDLVLELHLIPSVVPMTVAPRIGLYVSAAPAAHVPVMFKMGSKAIDIPAGARDYAIDDAFVLPVDGDLLSLYPHAHYLGKEMEVRATLPDGRVQTLLHIKHWSFHWQQDYRYVRPVPLPRGTRIAMRFTYDNSSGNDDNPHHPPQHVMAGQRSTDEMGNLGLQILTHSPADRVALVQAARGHDAIANVAGAEMLVRFNPDNAENQRFLGGSYVDVGRVAEALPHLEYAVKLAPDSAMIHNELGGALLARQRTLDAVAEFRRATELAPDDDRLHFNLAKALNAAGNADDSAREFERALALNPGLAEAHDELGVLLFSRRQLGDAIAHLKRATELDPESVIAESDLGGALAQAGQTAEALRHLRRALELDPSYGPARENLARLDKTRPKGP